MGHHGNVWLPGARVWAYLPQALDAGESSPSVSGRGGAARHDNREMEESRAQKRSRGLSRSWSCSRGEEAFEVGGSGLGSKVESGIFRVERGDDHGASSSSHDVICPICLGKIEAAEEAVLQWCMHRFCTHCIEEWSKVRRVCPLCKAEYRGWYHGVESNNEFQERILPPISELNPREAAARFSVSRIHMWRDFRAQERSRGRGRGHGVASGDSASSSSETLRRSVPFPTQRSFGLPRQHQSAQEMRILEHQAAARALEWRKSIYNRNLKARPFEFGRRSMVTQDAKARAERKLEPWIRRELEAVLPNADHAFLARWVLGLWFGSILRAESLGTKRGEQRRISTRNVAGSTEVEGVGEEAIKELKRFLGDKAGLFWHELRCFAESPFTMQAYDTVVVYTGQNNSSRPINRRDRRPSHHDRILDSRRRSELTVPRVYNEEPSHLENNHQILRVGRHYISQGCAAVVQNSLGQHQQENARNSNKSSEALLVGDSRADQRKKRSHLDVIPITEDRWQLSSC